jgi:hypothetical protein
MPVAQIHSGTPSNKRIAQITMSPLFAENRELPL